jgi:hypothetical protein
LTLSISRASARKLEWSIFVSMRRERADYAAGMR